MRLVWKILIRATNRDLHIVNAGEQGTEVRRKPILLLNYKYIDISTATLKQSSKAGLSSPGGMRVSNRDEQNSIANKFAFSK